jgi:hypothetical protein
MYFRAWLRGRSQPGVRKGFVQYLCFGVDAGTSEAAFILRCLAAGVWSAGSIFPFLKHHFLPPPPPPKATLVELRVGLVIGLATWRTARLELPGGADPLSYMLYRTLAAYVAACDFKGVYTRLWRYDGLLVRTGGYE